MKTTVSYKIDSDFLFFVKLIPELRNRLLSYTSSRAKETLIAEFLSGQEITLRNGTKDRLGRRLASYRKGNRMGTVYKISAYPLNLFDKGRTLRSGAREPGKRVLSEKLPARVNSRLNSIITDFEKLI